MLERNRTFALKQIAYVSLKKSCCKPFIYRKRCLVHEKRESNADTDFLFHEVTAYINIYIKTKSHSNKGCLKLTSIIKMLDGFIDHIFLTFGCRVFQQTSGIHVETNFSPLLVSLFF